MICKLFATFSSDTTCRFFLPREIDDRAVTSCRSSAILPCSYSSAQPGHTQNAHMFQVYEHCEVNIVQHNCIDPSNAKHVGLDWMLAWVGSNKIVKWRKIPRVTHRKDLRHHTHEWLMGRIYVKRKWRKTLEIMNTVCYYMHGTVLRASCARVKPCLMSILLKST